MCGVYNRNIVSCVSRVDSCTCMYRMCQHVLYMYMYNHYLTCNHSLSFPSFPPSLFRGEEGEVTSKKEFIQTARMIAKESEEVVKMARKVAKACTNKRMATVSIYM